MIAGNQLCHGVGNAVRKPEMAKIKVNPGVDCAMRIEADDADNTIVALFGDLGVDHDPLVIGREEAQVVVFLQGRVCPPRPVDGPDQVLDIARAVPIPDLVLVLLGMEVFLPARYGVASQSSKPE